MKTLFTIILVSFWSIQTVKSFQKYYSNILKQSARITQSNRKETSSCSTTTFLQSISSSSSTAVAASNNNEYNADNSDDHLNGLWKRVDVPSPLHLIVDFNMERNSVVYEVSLGREIGFDIVEGRDGLAVVGQVFPGSRAESIGIQTNDVIVASSATAGTKMWTHNSVDGIKSALSTRFVMSASVKMRFERDLNAIPQAVVRLLKIPQYFNVVVRRPIGLHVEEGDDKSVIVKRLTPELGAARTRRIEVGDQILSMSASWGDRMWEVNSVESFVVGVRLRTDTQLTFRMKRITPLTAYRGQLEARQVHSRGLPAVAPASATALASTTDGQHSASSSAVATSAAAVARVRSNKADTVRDSTESSNSGSSCSRSGNSINGMSTSASNVVGGSGISSDSASSNSPISTASQNTGASTPTGSSQQQQPSSPPSPKVFQTLSEQIDAASKTADMLSQLWLNWTPVEKARLSAYDVNKFMSTALSLELPALAVRVFEDMCGFVYSPQDPAGALSRQLIKAARQKEDSAAMFWSAQGASSSSSSTPPLVLANNFICTTAAKAYGRNFETEKAIALLPWLEQLGEPADIYFLSALLYVCAKDRRVKEAEHFFWHEIPRRNLTYAVATTNSIMYMYARQNRPDDALRVYDMTKRLGIKCTVVTYGVLIKALLRSGRKQLQDASYEILRSLPEIGIAPGIEVYNQFLEHFSSTHDFRQTKIVLKLMSRSKPRVKPDSLSYGYLINCFADAKKPRSALAAYRQMRNAKLPSNAYTYMGVLKALLHLRDGISSVQVLAEMREVGVVPDKRHHCMAMFTCVASDMCPLAESIFNSLLKSKQQQRPDTALYTLYLRALLQQNKWEEAETLFSRMMVGKDGFARPNSFTLNYLLQYQMLGGRWQQAADTLNIIAESLENTAAASSTSSSSGTAANGKQRTTGTASGMVVKSTTGDGLELSSPSALIITRKRQTSSSSSRLSVPLSTLQGTYHAMSLALGSYSDTLQRLKQQETMRLQRAEDALRGEDDLFFSPESYEYMSPSMRVEKPSKEALRFLVSATYKLSSLTDCGYIQGDFYGELLRALAMEGEPWIAQECVKSLQSRVRVKVDDQEKVAAAEELVSRICIELNKAGRLPPSTPASKWLYENKDLTTAAANAGAKV